MRAKNVVDVNRKNHKNLLLSNSIFPPFFLYYVKIKNLGHQDTQNERKSIDKWMEKGSGKSDFVEVNISNIANK